MSSLNHMYGRLTGRSDVAGTTAPAANINPIALAIRSRARSFRRRLDAIPAPRPGRGTSLALAFIFCGWFYGSVVAGTASSLISGIGSGVGLGATDVLLTGQAETGEHELIDALALGSKGSLLGFDTAAARKRILALPWVDDVAIRKIYPGRLTVAVTEKSAAAVWQHNDRLTVVERSGKPIAKFGIADLLNNRFSHLPHLVGEGASQAASEILPPVLQYPVLSEHVISYIRIANRRWDLGLANGIKVMLPETGLSASLARLAQMVSQDRLLERQLDVIDLRLDDRVVLRLQPDAAAVRAELVAARLKSMKNADRNL